MQDSHLEYFGHRIYGRQLISLPQLNTDWPTECDRWGGTAAYLEPIEDALVLVGVGLQAALDQVERHNGRVGETARQDATEAGDGEELGRAILAAVLRLWWHGTISKSQPKLPPGTVQTRYHAVNGSVLLQRCNAKNTQLGAWGKVSTHCLSGLPVNNCRHCTLNISTHTHAHSVSQNFPIWVENDTQMKIIFHSHFNFFTWIFHSQNYVASNITFCWMFDRAATIIE